MVAAKYNLYIEQGCNFDKSFVYQDTTVDLTGYSARMQVRAAVTSSTALLDLHTSSTGLSISVPDRSVSINLSPSVTAALSFDTAVYDLELITATGGVTRLLNGDVTLSKEVTK